jgi:hypothetical protein
MAVEPKPKTVRKKKRRRVPQEEFVDYVVEIEGWDWAIRSRSIRPRIRTTPTTSSGTFRSPASWCGRPG